MGFGEYMSQNIISRGIFYLWEAFLTKHHDLLVGATAQIRLVGMGSTKHIEYHET